MGFFGLFGQGTKSAAAKYHAAVALSKQGAYDKAIELFTKAIRSDPNFDHAYKSRGDDFMMKGEYAKAIADYTVWIKLHPRDAKGYSKRAFAYYMKQADDGVIEDCTTVINLGGGDADSFFYRGAAHVRLSHHEKAIPDLSQAIERDPRNPRAYELRARCYKAIGDATEAFVDEAKVRELKQAGAV